VIGDHELREFRDVLVHRLRFRQRAGVYVHLIGRHHDLRDLRIAD
jgi:hypothetical protein